MSTRTNAEGTALFADACLCPLLSELTDEVEGVYWSFGTVTPGRLNSEAYAGVALPVFNPAQATRLAGLAAEYPLTTLVGVVRDASGIQTHLALQSGAVCVLNVLVPASRSISAIRAAVLAGADGALGADPGDAALTHQLNPPTTTGPVPAEQSDVRLSEDDALLVRLMCEGETTAELSRRFYCSERSMYRRLRRLYNQLSVSNRRELHRLRPNLAG